MRSQLYQFNLVLAWLWILFGFVSGMLLGLKFHEADWLGGYSSLRRRMYRLAHISFFGLGAANLLFYLTGETLGAGLPVAIASWLFAAGAVSMPLCCVLMAHFPRTKNLFAVPVISLITAGTLTVIPLLKL